MEHFLLAPYDEDDALQALLCDASDGDGDGMALFEAPWGDAAPAADAADAADFRCLEPGHGAACTRCAPCAVELTWKSPVSQTLSLH